MFEQFKNGFGITFHRLKRGARLFQCTVAMQNQSNLELPITLGLKITLI